MKYTLFVASLVIATFCGPSGADIKVRAFTPGGQPLVALTQDNIVSGANVTINIAGVNVGRIFIYDGNIPPVNDSIGAVTISGASSAGSTIPLFVTVATPAIVGGGIPAFPEAFIDAANPTATYALNFASLTVSNTT